MFLSVFDIFKIGVGPSSSHTMGPMLAAARLPRRAPRRVRPHPRLQRPHPAPRRRLHGSLAFTGKGHATDRAVILGLLGFVPDTLDPTKAERPPRRPPRPATIDVPGLGPSPSTPTRASSSTTAPPRPRQRHGPEGLRRRRQPPPHRDLLLDRRRLRPDRAPAPHRGRSRATTPRSPGPTPSPQPPRCSPWARPPASRSPR